MTIEERLLLEQTRRHFFRNCTTGIGKMALLSLMGEKAFAVRHYPAKVEHVIYCSMAGGPSHLELFDYKPELVKWDGKPTPDTYLKGKRFAFMDTFSKETPKLLGTRRQGSTGRARRGPLPRSRSSGSWTPWAALSSRQTNP